LGRRYEYINVKQPRCFYRAAGLQPALPWHNHEPVVRPSVSPSVCQTREL